MTSLPHPFPMEAEEERAAYLKAFEAEGLAYDNLEELRQRRKGAAKRLYKKLDALGYNNEMDE